MNYLNNIARSLEAYSPGEQPQGDDWIKLNTNENPFPPAPEAIAALRSLTETPERLRKYPHPLGEPLRSELAARWNLRPEEVLVTNGSDEALTLICRSFLESADSAAYPEVSYALYSTLIHAAGGQVLTIPMRDYHGYPLGVDLEGLVNAKAKVLFLPNPNAMTGELLSTSKLAEAIAENKKLWIIDEAYNDFTDKPSSMIPFLRDLPNMIVTTTFSKSRSLAGMRIGALYCSNPAHMQGLTAMKDSYNIDAAAIACGSGALKAERAFRENLKTIGEEREKLVHDLTETGFHVLPSQANFLLIVPPRVSAKELYEDLKARKILVRYFDSPALKSFVRVSIGSPEENRAFINTAKEIVG